MQPWEEKYAEMAKIMGIDPSVSIDSTGPVCNNWSWANIMIDKEICSICSNW